MCSETGSIVVVGAGSVVAVVEVAIVVLVLETRASTAVADSSPEVEEQPVTKSTADTAIADR